MRNELTNRIRTAIKNIEPGAEIFLFGSRARGDHRAESDWDVLVVSPKREITIDYELKLRDPILDLELETGEVISLLVYSKSDWRTKQKISPLFYNVSNEGIQL